MARKNAFREQVMEYADKAKLRPMEKIALRFALLHPGMEQRIKAKLEQLAGDYGYVIPITGPIDWSALMAAILTPESIKTIFAALLKLLLVA